MDRKWMERNVQIRTILIARLMWNKSISVMKQRYSEIFTNNQFFFGNKKKFERNVPKVNANKTFLLIQFLSFYDHIRILLLVEQIKTFQFVIYFHWEEISTTKIPSHFLFASFFWFDKIIIRNIIKGKTTRKKRVKEIQNKFPANRISSSRV